jgi:hypothetical protein
LKRILIIVLAVIGILCIPAPAQKPSRPADNAALRYWMAFAQMNDSPISSEDATLMDAIVTGKAPWDEQKFGPLVEHNKEAIETMIRGTRLPSCDWGIEYDLGPDAPIAYLPKARALGRLSGLYAKRLANSGDYDSAVRATIAGIRFALHLAENASFLGTLTAKAVLIPQLEQVEQMAASRRLSAAQLTSLRLAVKALPEGAFDWANAARLEGDGMRRALVTLSHANDPKALYQEWFGGPAPVDFRIPNDKELLDLKQMMVVYARLLEIPADAAQAQLPALQKQIAGLDAVSQMAVPNPARVLAARAEVIGLQRRTAEALGIH